MNREIFRQLLQLYMRDELTDAEKIRFNELLDQPGYMDMLDEFLRESLLAGESGKNTAPAIGEAIQAFLHEHIDPAGAGSPGAGPGSPGAGSEEVRHLYPRQRSRWWAAAAIILILGACAYLYSFFHSPGKALAKSGTPQQHSNDLSPGTTGAILTLSGGKQIVLDSMGSGELTVQGNTRLIAQSGRIAYKEEGEAHTGGPLSPALLYNTLFTPRGRTYQLVLADGTKVYLNAASSLRYPAAFSGGERRVEITGEAYFEVAHSATPFIVHILSSSPGNEGSDIKVLGTRFNVNAYEDEHIVRTTLIEGAVKVNVRATSNGNHSAVRTTDGIRLSPGQQARIDAGGEITLVEGVDTAAVMAWKNGYFYFNQTDLTTVMAQIARWYDVDIVYETKPGVRRFGGEISRSTNASQVLQILEESKVHCTIEGRKIIVR